MKAFAYGIVRYGILPTLLGAGLAALLLACAGASGDAAPAASEAGADAGTTVIIVDCTDGATE